MSTAVLNMIKQLDKEETNQVVDYVQYILSKRKQYSLSEGCLERLSSLPA